MGMPSQPASNAIIYLTLGAFLYVNCGALESCDRGTTKLTRDQGLGMLRGMAIATPVKD
jgi:hypothetical protein